MALRSHAKCGLDAFTKEQESSKPVSSSLFFLLKNPKMNLSSLLSVISKEWPPPDWQEPAVTPHHSLRAIKLLFILKRIIYLGLEVTAISAISKTKQPQRRKKKKKKKKKLQFSQISQDLKRNKKLLVCLLTGWLCSSIILIYNCIFVLVEVTPQLNNGRWKQINLPTREYKTRSKEQPLFEVKTGSGFHEYTKLKNILFLPPFLFFLLICHERGIIRGV